MNNLAVDDHPSLARTTALVFRTGRCRTFMDANIASTTLLLGPEKIDGVFLDVPRHDLLRG